MTVYDRDNIGDPGERDWHHPGTVVFWLCHVFGGVAFTVTQQFPPQADWYRRPRHWWEDPDYWRPHVHL